MSRTGFLGDLITWELPHGTTPRHLGPRNGVAAAAATLLPELAVAQDVYLRAGIDLSRPADADCASLVPAALYGCGVGGDGAPRRSLGDVGTVAGVELGLGTPWRLPCGWRPS